MKETNKDTVGQYFYQMDTHVFPLLGALAIAMVVVVAVPTLGGTTEGASESYNLTVDDAVDIPDQNASINGTQTTVSSTVSVAPGLPVEANVSAPAGDTVRVLLVDTDGERYASAVVNGSGSVTAPTTGLNTGTYYLTVQNGKTIEQAQEVVISDLDEDDRISREAIESDHDLSFYAGAPLRTADGHCLGMVCVLDDRDRSFTSDDERALTWFAEQVMANVERRGTN